jgi:hypothetical protein
MITFYHIVYFIFVIVIIIIIIDFIIDTTEPTSSSVSNPLIAAYYSRHHVITTKPKIHRRIGRLGRAIVIPLPLLMSSAQFKRSKHTILIGQMSKYLTCEL